MWDKCNTSGGLRALCGLVVGETDRRFFQIACRVERGGFGASEWGRGALLLLGCGG